MSTKRRLLARWASSEGQVRAKAVIDALKRGTAATELRMALVQSRTANGGYGVGEASGTLGRKVTCRNRLLQSSMNRIHW
jgi:hypothetical protein